MNCMSDIKEVAYVIANSRDDARFCEQILDTYLRFSDVASVDKMRSNSLLSYYVNSVPNDQFRKLFHVNRSTVQMLRIEIESITPLRFLPCKEQNEENTIENLALCVLFLNSQFSVNFLSAFCGQPKNVVQSNVLHFFSVLDGIKERVIYFPSPDSQRSNVSNKNTFLPGSVGVLDTVLIPDFSVRDRPLDLQRGIKLLLVVDNSGSFLHLYCTRDCSQSNCRLFNKSLLGSTLRYHKRSVLNRGSYLIADRSFPELPYVQVPFSTQEIKESAYPTLFSSYNYWHHRSRFIAHQSIQRWLFRSPRCRYGFSFPSDMGLSYVVASLVLHQLCQQLDDVWNDDDSKIQFVVLASKDGEVVEGVDEECHAFYEAPDGKINSYESRYYNLDTTAGETAGETATEQVAVNIYDKLKWKL